MCRRCCRRRRCRRVSVGEVGGYDEVGKEEEPELVGRRRRCNHL